jgi:hypothetical protein
MKTERLLALRLGAKNGLNSSEAAELFAHLEWLEDDRERIAEGRDSLMDAANNSTNDHEFVLALARVLSNFLRR